MCASESASAICRNTSAAFGTESARLDRRPDHIYLNGSEFGVPLWLLNATEICAWLSAAEQTQEPVLKDWWAIAKAGNANVADGGTNLLRHAVTKATNILQTLDAQRVPYKRTCLRQLKIFKDYVGQRQVNGLAELEAKFAPYSTQYNATGNGLDWDSPENEAEIRAAAETVITSLKSLIAQDMELAQLSATTADSPLHVPKKLLIDPTLLDAATPADEVTRIEGHLTTLKLRLKTRLDDPRWQSFLNYESTGTTCTSLKDWMGRSAWEDGKGRVSRSSTSRCSAMKCCRMRVRL